MESPPAGDGLALRLITPDSWLYTATDREMPPHWFGLPWWGFLWPGGYGVAQYVQQNPAVAKGRRVVDFAAGCGVAGIVAAQAGAAEVICNDICPLACTASIVNAELNAVHAGGEWDAGGAAAAAPLGGATLWWLADDLLAPGGDAGCTEGSSTFGGARSCIRPGDLMLVGDAMYDITIANLLLPWLQELAAEGVEVLLGDPRRWVINEMSADERDATFEFVADYPLPAALAAEHYGMRSTLVYRVRSRDQ